MNAERSLHILHIEEDENHAETIWKALEKSGLDYRVTLVMTRDAYERKLQEGDVDIVLSESRGLDFEGEEALRYVHAHYPGIPFLFLVSSLANRDPHALMAEGAAQCLLKSHLRALVPAIRSAVGAIRPDAMHGPSGGGMDVDIPTVRVELSARRFI